MIINPFRVSSKRTLYQSIGSSVHRLIEVLGLDSMRFRRVLGGGKDGHEFVGLFLEISQQSSRHKSPISNQFQPEHDLVGFFYDHTHLSEKFGS